MFNIKRINFTSRVIESDDNMFRFEILYYGNLFITDNKKYVTLDECVDALAGYLKKLCSHCPNEPFTVQL